MNIENDPSHQRPPAQRLVQLEQRARNGLLALIVGAALVTVGQYSGASAVASSMQRARMDAWSAKSSEHAAAMATYLDCYFEGTQVHTKRGCVELAATGRLADELDSVTTTPKAAWEAMPAPLRWLIN